MEQRHPRQIRPMHRWTRKDLMHTAERSIVLIKKYFNQQTITNHMNKQQLAIERHKSDTENKHFFLLCN